MKFNLLRRSTGVVVEDQDARRSRLELDERGDAWIDGISARLAGVDRSWCAVDEVAYQVDGVRIIQQGIGAPVRGRPVA